MIDQDEVWLKDRCYQAEGAYLRPFAPNRQWKQAKVFIVGLNPATPLRDEFDSFDHYWQALTHDPEQYDKVYREKHQRAETEKSRTSRRIKDLLGYLEPINVLVTNVFAYPSSNPKLIPNRLKREPLNESIICRLISICEPKVLFFHGREARKFASRYFGVTLNPYEAPSSQCVKGQIPNTSATAWLFSYHHFVGRVDTHTVMDERIRQFAEQICLRLEQG